MTKHLIEGENFWTQTLDTIYLKGVNQEISKYNSKNFRAAFSCPDLLILL